MRAVFACELVYPSGDGEDYDCAQQCGAYDWKPLRFDEVEMEHKSYSGRDEEKTEIFHQKVGYAAYPTKFYYLSFQSCGKEQHTYNA